jgi:hypothetical protein
MSDGAPTPRYDEAYAIAFWIATEARVKERLGLSVQPVEAEGARRIAALAEVPAHHDNGDAHEITVLMNAMEAAWGIVANVSGSDWTLQSEDWQGAAARWRDEHWHTALDRNGYPDRVDTERRTPLPVEGEALFEGKDAKWWADLCMNWLDRCQSAWRERDGASQRANALEAEVAALRTASPREPDGWISSHDAKNYLGHTESWCDVRIFKSPTDSPAAAVVPICIGAAAPQSAPLLRSAVRPEVTGISEGERALRDLVTHVWLHSGYPRCGYKHMSTPEKRLFDSIVGPPDGEMADYAPPAAPSLETDTPPVEPHSPRPPCDHVCLKEADHEGPHFYGFKVGPHSPSRMAAALADFKRRVYWWSTMAVSIQATAESALADTREDT